MTDYTFQPPLVPRDGRTLRVLEIDRISTKNQDIKSNDDQSARNRQWVEDRYNGPVKWTRITGQGSGESLNREQVLEAETKVTTGRYDLVIMEDLGRHLRRIHAVVFCELCEDKGTRLIAINDGIDTSGDWRIHAFFAAIRHEQYNKDTSQRIKRTLRNRFMNGEALERRIYGYIDPLRGAKHDSQRQKDPEAEAVYQIWFQRLENGASFSEIADWLNQQGVPTGPYCPGDEWTSAMVARITQNPILKGLRQHNRRTTKRQNETGKYVSVPANPTELLERKCPHLAFFEEEYYDRVVRCAKENNSRFAPGQEGNDPRRGRPKTRTRWPGQHIYCGICGRLYRYGGHGQTQRLLCCGAYEYKCWNAISVNAPVAAEKLAEAISDEIQCLPGFDEDFQNRLKEELRHAQDGFIQQKEQVQREINRLDRQLGNIRAALREYGPSPTLLAELQQLEESQAQSLDQRNELQATPQLRVEIPSATEIHGMAQTEFQGLAVDSPEFSRLVKRLIPRIVVFPLRHVCGGAPVLRACFNLYLSSLIPAAKHLPSLAQILRRTRFVDLFDPPLPERYREHVKLRTSQAWAQRQIAEELGTSQAIVQRAAALERQLQQESVTHPYQILTEPPADFPKLRRHNHPRFQYDPLPYIALG